MSEPTQPGVVLATEDEVKRRKQEVDDEWGTYVAVADITHNGVMAYTAGDPVPKSNAERYGYEQEGLVKRVDSAEAQDVIRQLHEQGGTLNPVQPPLPPRSLSVPLRDMTVPEERRSEVSNPGVEAQTEVAGNTQPQQ
jgi:hypothetical protein